ncbi:MAG TPA: hypothetical protein PLP34_05725 [Chitinophagaceae bacterium]|nr:hypothetical protein [Chitinophagaceae bacterium]HNF71890.1 hypothetical protein [Chitinophagaceae bacterium]
MKSTPRLHLLFNTLIAFLAFIVFSSASSGGRSPYVKISDASQAITEIRNFALNPLPNRIRFANAYTLNLPALNRYRSDYQGKAILITNALYNASLQGGNNAIFLVTLFDANNVAIVNNDVMMMNAANLCPPNCDLAITNGPPQLANGRLSLNQQTAAQYKSNYVSNSSAENSFDGARSVYIPANVIDNIIASGASGIRVYHAIDNGNQQRCVYVCGLNANGEMISNSFYKGDASNLCPPNCD